LTNKDKAWEFAFSPNSLNEDGQNLTIAYEGKHSAAAGSWESLLSANFGGYKLGPISPFIRFAYTANNKKESLLENTGNFVYEKDLHVAYKMEMDLKSKNYYEEAFGALIYKNQTWGAAWLRTNCVQRFAALGWAGRAWGACHVAEAQYDYSAAAKDIKTKGLGGLPLYLRVSNAFTLSEGAKLSMTSRIGQRIDVSGKMTIPVQKDLTVNIEERCNLESLLTGEAGDVNYQWGIGIEYKL